MEKEVVEIKGNLHLYGFNSSSVAFDLDDNGMELMIYTATGGKIEDKVTEMNYTEFLKEHQGKKVEVQGSVILFGEKLEKKGE